MDRTTKKQDSEQRFRLAIANTPIIVATCDVEGRYTWIYNPDPYFRPETVVGRRDEEVLPPEDVAELAALKRSVLESHQCARRELSVTIEGVPHWYDVTVEPMRNPEGDLAGLAIGAFDITPLKQADQEIRLLNASLEEQITARTAELEASKQRLTAVLDAAIDAIITIDANGTIETFNGGAERMFGYTAGEAISRNVSVLMGPPFRDEHDEYLRRYRETGEARMIGRVRTLRARRKDGTEFPIQLSVSEVDRNGTYIGVIRDTTEQRALEDEIVRIAALEKRRIGQELHDDIQQDLTGLGLLAQNLSEVLDGHGQERDRTLAAKLAAGIATVNRRARLLARGLVPVPVSADGLMAALDELARSTEEAHGITCRFECPANFSVPNDSVALHLYHISQEAVTNAIKHADAESISIQLEHTDRELELRILDDGIGINECDRDNRGLGLRIMEYRCRLVGGVSSVQQRETGGTVVSCRIPKPL